MPSSLVLFFALGAVVPAPPAGENPLPAGAVLRLGEDYGHHIDALAFSALGQWLASANFNPPKRGKVRQPGFVVKIWDVINGGEILQIAGHRTPVVALAFGDQDSLLAAATADGTVHVWKTDGTGEAQRLRGKPFRGTVTLRLSRDGHRLAAGDAQSLTVWDVENGRRLREFDRPVTVLALSRDGRFLAAADEANGDVVLLDPADGDTLITWKGPKDLVALSFSWRSDRLVAAAAGREVVTYDPAGRKELSRIRLGEGGAGVGKLIALCEDGSRAWTRDANGRLGYWWATDAGALPSWSISKFTGRAPVMSPCGRWAVTAADEALVAWETSARERFRFVDARAYVNALAFSPDGRNLFAGGSNAALSRWQLPQGALLSRTEGRSWEMTLLRLYPQGRAWAEAGAWEEAVADRFRRRRVLALRQSDPGPLDKLGTNTPAVAAGGNTLASASANGIFLWDATTGAARGFVTQESAPAALAVAPDGALVVFSNGRDDIHFWAVPAEREAHLARGGAGGVARLLFSPNGRTLFVRLGGAGAGYFLEVPSGGKVGDARLPRLAWDHLAFSPDGRALAGAAGPVVVVWQADTGEELYRFQAGGRVGALAFSPDGKHLASAVGQSVLLWDVAGRFAKYRTRPTRITAAELDTLWEDLAGRDAARGAEVMGKLLGDPAEAVRLLDRRLRPSIPDPRQIRQWVLDLENDRYAVREKAQRALTQLGETAEPWLKKALAADPSLETRRRAEAILKNLRKIPFLDPDKIRLLRAVEVLEFLGTPEAQRVLERLAGNAPDAWETRQARAALGRVRKCRGDALPLSPRSP